MEQVARTLQAAAFFKGYASGSRVHEEASNGRLACGRREKGGGGGREGEGVVGKLRGVGREAAQRREAATGRTMRDSGPREHTPPPRDQEEFTNQFSVVNDSWASLKPTTHDENVERFERNESESKHTRATAGW
jgi:hypothetical protein